MKNWMEPACPIHSTLCIGASNRREINLPPNNIYDHPLKKSAR